ncbi:uncharacterized protein LOC110918304 [Helianthus annuus]|uniref:uncharacterized protein LOC110918304 n=1 Tax=Helianthus annuus TaxID=4232 RepID=UPI000B90038A|nr:uncharacterized protein LOC110918304 [Helianthus annuus]
MADHSDDEVIEISRVQFVQTVDEALRKEYGFFFSHEEPNVPQDSCIPQKDTITIEGSGNTSKVKQHEVQCTSKAFISQGSQSHTEDAKENIDSVGSSKYKKRLDGDSCAQNTIPEDQKVLNFTRKGEYRLRLPVGVSKRAGFKKKLHTLNIENMQGQVTTYEVKPERNGKALRYSVIDWPVFMAENNLNDGDMLDFTYVNSKKTVILKNVRHV